MPTAPSKPCPIPGCRSLGGCEIHDLQRHRETRVTQLARDPTRAFYQSREWKKASAAQLRREPNCRRCGKAATTADHIRPVSEGGARTDPANLQSLCRRCHGTKTHEDRHRRKVARQ